MGKGDKKTRRGKIYNGSHGKTRPRKVRKTAADQTATKSTTRRGTTRKK